MNKKRLIKCIGLALCFSGLLAVICLPAFAAEPVLKDLRPHGAQRGTAFRLTLVGSSLPQDAKIITTLPAVFTPLTSLQRDESSSADDEIPFLVELQKDASIGLYPLRVNTSGGLSNLLLFSVGAFPERMEEEATQLLHQPSNDSLEHSQLIEEIPTVINGTLSGPDRDIYRIHARKGERLVFEVEARRAGSAVDPVIRILDPGNRQIAISNDTPTLGVDCRLEVSFPVDGEYHVVVHDASFVEQEQNFYRLKMGSFTYADGHFPLGWTRGEKAKVQLFGGNLTGIKEVTVDLGAVDKSDDFTLISIPGEAGSLPIPFAVSDLPEILEPETQEVIRLEPSRVVNGRISEAGEIDRYDLSVNPGESWLIDLQARELGTSRLSGVLTIYDDKNQRLTSAGDEIPDPDLFSLLAPGRTSADPFISFQVPEGSRRVSITVEDLVQAGGPLYGYRLLAQKQPDFTLTLATPFVNVPEGGTASVKVDALRLGYFGTIQLIVEDPGDDLIVKGGVIPSEDTSSRSISRQTMLTISAKIGAKQQLRELSVWGEAVLDNGTAIRRRARGPGLVTQILGSTGVPNPGGPDRLKPFLATWLGFELPMMVTEKIPAKLVVDTQQVRLVQGMVQDFHWRFLPDSPDLRPPETVTIATPGGRELTLRQTNRDKKYQEEGVITLITTMGTPPMRFNAVISGEMDFGDVRQRITAPAISVEVVQGYEIVVPPDGFKVRPGSGVELAARVRRDSAFSQPVKVRAEELPPGVSCEAAEVTGSQEEFRVVCQADPSAVPGDYRILLSSSSVLAGREKEKVPYLVPAVETRLVVLTPSSAEGSTAQKEG